MSSFAVVMAAAVAWLAPAAHASQWTDIATISSTLGNNANYLCVGGASTDLGCPTTAPYVDPSTGYIGIGTTSPIAPLQITSSTYTNNVYIGDNLDAFGSGGINAGGAIYFGASYAPGPSSTTAGIEASWSGGTLPQISIGTLRQNLPTFAKFDYLGRIYFYSQNKELMRLNNNGRVGISTTSPQTTLDVSGTLRIADGGETCSASILGAVKYSGGAFYICQNAATGWEQISTSGGAVTTDHIVSSTTSVYAAQTGLSRSPPRASTPAGSAPTPASPPSASPPPAPSAAPSVISTASASAPSTCSMPVRLYALLLLMRWAPAAVIPVRW